jgi:hypothetical protein
MILRSKFFVMLSLLQFLTVFGSYLSVKLRD